MAELINPNPVVFERKERKTKRDASSSELDCGDVFELIRDIQDPEHPYSLEQLNVLKEDMITLDNSRQICSVQFTPTVDHCSMATLIGLCIRTQLLRKLPKTFKFDISITEGGHASRDAVNKQLNDKERVSAALENPNLLRMVEQCLAPANVPV